MPAIFFHVCWWSYMIKHDLFHLFEEKYYMTITMIFGSMIAGDVLVDLLFTFHF